MPSEPQPRTRCSPFWSEGSLQPFWSLYFSSGHPSMPWSENRAASQLADWLGACTKPRELLGSNVGSGARRTGQEDTTPPRTWPPCRQKSSTEIRPLGRLHTQGAIAMGKDSWKRRHLGPELASRLTGRAWAVTYELSHKKLSKKNGTKYLLCYLQDQLSNPGA